MIQFKVNSTECVVGYCVHGKLVCPVAFNKVYRSHYKGHMDKIKGEGGGGGEMGVWLVAGVEGWGENADNCN